MQTVNADWFFCLERDEHGAPCKLVFDFSYLRNLGGGASLQHRIAWLSSGKTTVDNPGKRLDMRAA